MLIGVVTVVMVNFSAPTSESSPVVFEIEANDTYNSIASELKEAGLIKSEFFYKLYIRMTDLNGLEIGLFNLDRNMDLKTLVSVLDNDGYYETIKFVVPEGYHITDIASFVAEGTTYSEEEVMTLLTDDGFIDAVISKYWFVTNDVLNENLKYSLEGYLFPATYEVNKDASLEDIIYTMLDKTGSILDKYKVAIDNSSFSVHEILTFASVVEYEAGQDSERARVAGVFYNRLDLGMLLQSCATVGYAIGEWKAFYTYADLAYDSLYNTYMYQGLPIGPGNSPGEASIEAVLFPEDHDYLYFVANIETKETYFSETYAEHQQNCIDKLGTTC